MSNICTNESLLAVTAAAYMAVLGSNGLRRVAADNIRRARDLAASIDRIRGFEAPVFKGAHFNEFTVRAKGGHERVRKGLLERGVHGGIALKRYLPELEDVALFTTTERHTPEDYAALLGALEALA
jgi:glycine dehydrogenase subunit 1